MRTISEIINKKEEKTKYGEIRDQIKKATNQLCWSSTGQKNSLLVLYVFANMIRKI